MRLRSTASLILACCVKAELDQPRETRWQHRLAELECKAGITDAPGCKKPEPFHQLARDLKVAICPDDKGAAFYEAVSIRLFIFSTHKSMKACMSSKSMVQCVKYTAQTLFA
jgi:hypothetical protein